ncbi:unnamed protein product, partial [Musa textilis]
VAYLHTGTAPTTKGVGVDGARRGNTAPSGATLTDTGPAIWPHYGWLARQGGRCQWPQASPPCKLCAR